MTPTGTTAARPSGTGTPPRVAVLDVPGARIHHEVRGSGPLVVLLGSPMDADAFAPLADLLAVDHTVLTLDPRGIHRSPVDDPGLDSPPETRADDVSRLLAHLDAGPAVVLGSSGGAVTALALVQAHPEQLRAVIAHEPPLDELLPDRDHQRALTRDYCETYLAGDVVGAWRKFFDQADIAMPDGALEQWFGGERDPRTVADEHFWFAHELRPTVWWTPDLDALRDGGVQLVLGVGEDSTGQACDRTTAALATALGMERTTFPGGHTGFAEDPATFEPRLRAVLAQL